jgi:hypothetical protein
MVEHRMGAKPSVPEADRVSMAQGGCDGIVRDTIQHEADHANPI